MAELSTYGQFSSYKIETDSTDVEVIKNSLYKIYNETYKDKDSVWYSVHFIKDTTRLYTEGWARKDKKQVGVWKAFTFERRFLYVVDYENGTFEVNKSLYPYHDLLERMKLKADSLIMSAYSLEFFDNHVRFRFDCFVYDEKGYVGSWIEPIIRRPTEFLFRYSVKLKTSEWYDEMIGIELDSTGKYKPSEDIFNNYGFEKVRSQRRNFQIDKKKAIQVAQRHGLKMAYPNKITEFLMWERFNKAEFYDGQFNYYITELTGEIKNTKDEGRPSITYKYNIYSFNPWTGDFIEIKKMKNTYSWEKLSGHWTGLIPENE